MVKRWHHIPYLLHSSIILKCSWTDILYSWSATIDSCCRSRLLWVRRMSSSSVSRRRWEDSWLEIRFDNLDTNKTANTDQWDRVSELFYFNLLLKLSSVKHSRWQVQATIYSTSSNLCDRATTGPRHDQAWRLDNFSSKIKCWDLLLTLEQSMYLNTNLPVREPAAIPSFFCLVFLVVPLTERSPPPQAWPVPEAVAYRGNGVKKNTSPSISWTCNGLFRVTRKLHMKKKAKKNPNRFIPFVRTKGIRTWLTNTLQSTGKRNAHERLECGCAVCAKNDQDR